MLVYAHFCDDCGATHRKPVDVCEWCGSGYITKAVAYGQVEYDDVDDGKRMAEIRAESAKVWVEMDRSRT